MHVYTYLQHPGYCRTCKHVVQFPAWSDRTYQASGRPRNGTISHGKGSILNERGNRLNHGNYIDNDKRCIGICQDSVQQVTDRSIPLYIFFAATNQSSTPKRQEEKRNLLSFYKLWKVETHSPSCHNSRLELVSTSANRERPCCVSVHVNIMYVKLLVRYYDTITKILINPAGSMSICIRYYGNPSNSRWSTCFTQ